MLLETIQTSADIKKLSPEQLRQLATEIRVRIVECVSSNGGHVASSLGAVELIIALHYCLDTPRDKIIFDVGHQAYAHKILTGRSKNFNTLRQYQGISGFPSSEESIHDVFSTGHSSNSISLALGLACGRDSLEPSEHFKIAAVIGDGSLSGGLAFEGLNNAGHLKKDIVVIINTNELSIAPNVGALSTYLNKVISLPVYNRFRDSLENFIKSRIPRGSRLIKLANKFEEGLKGLFIPGMLFEELGFRYFGPLDGHNQALLINTLKNILTIKGPRILHVVTKKGKGYPPAENDPVRFHGLGPFDIATGKPLDKENPENITFTDAFSRKLTDLAGKNKKIIAITAAMPEGTGLDKFRDNYPERLFDVGIAEGHAVTFSGGLAKAGLRPVVAVYSTFLQRAYDQIIEDVALQKAPVVFAIDRAGIVGEDGVTHQGIFDLAFLRSVPNLTVMAPCDAAELEKMLEFAFDSEGPVAIRYPKSLSVSVENNNQELKPGKAVVLREGKDFYLLALGSMVNTAIEAADILKKEGLSGTVVNARFAKPLDKELFTRFGSAGTPIFTLEEGIIDGGFGTAVFEAINKPVLRMGLPCEFIPHGKRGILLDKYGLSAVKIADSIKKNLK
ncbi:1-deoxy-D-xylulose-5-phosphate synthase [bacterium]|nr:MAG: 1-deoxy-D-xylulose-5-phosphate synthase [bacterium]